MRYLGGPLDGESRDIGISITAEGYREIIMHDGPLAVRWAVHDSITASEAPRAIRRATATLHNAILRSQKQPLYGTPEAVNMIHRELMQVWMRAEFLGVDIDAGRTSLQPPAMGNTKGWVNVTAKTL